MLLIFTYFVELVDDTGMGKVQALQFEFQSHSRVLLCCSAFHATICLFLDKFRFVNGVTEDQKLLDISDEETDGIKAVFLSEVKSCLFSSD